MSLKIERTFKHFEVQHKNTFQGELIHLVDKYEGDTSGLKSMVVKPGVGEKSWVQQLIVPLVSGATVHVHPDQTDVDPNFVRVVHDGTVSVFHKSHFDSIL